MLIKELRELIKNCKDNEQIFILSNENNDEINLIEIKDVIRHKESNFIMIIPMINIK